MGAFCCCLCCDEFEEYAHPSSSIYRHCICLRYFLHRLFNGYNPMFQRLEGRTATGPILGPPFTSTGLTSSSSNNSISDSYHHSVPRPMPYDADPRFSRLQRDGLISRRDKVLSHLQEGSQPLRRSCSCSGVEALGLAKKWSELDSEERCKAIISESSEKALSTKASEGVSYMMFASSEDEDVCPTCLEEYTPENPKIVTRCSHHFHLCCIYEWMERSENCPICGKEMEFCESP